MCGLLLPSWPSPSSLRLEGTDATVPLRPIFAIVGDFTLLDLAIAQDLFEPTLLLFLPLPLLRPLLTLEGETLPPTPQWLIR